MTYSRICPRCDGSGKYDRGTCFTCKGAKRIKSVTPPKAKFEATAIFADGVRRLLCTKNSKEAAIKCGSDKMAMGGVEFWDFGTLEVRQIES